MWTGRFHCMELRPYKSHIFRVIVEEKREKPGVNVEERRNQAVV